MNSINGKLAIDSPRSIARYRTADFICIACFVAPHAPVVVHARFLAPEKKPTCCDVCGEPADVLEVLRPGGEYVA